MLHAWWCGGPFVVPVCDLVFTFGLIIYISIEWIKGIFQINGVTRIPAIILPTWTPPANALGSLWLPVVFCTAFLLLLLHVARMLVTVKHARNPLQPGVKHFIFGFSIVIILGFSGLCGLLAVDVLNAMQIFGVGVTCTPLAGVINPACLAARTYFAGRHVQTIVLLAILITVSAFAIFGEIIIVWSVLRSCLFGPHIHTCNPMPMPPCASPCLAAEDSLPQHSLPFDEYQGWGKDGGDYCVPVGTSNSRKLVHAGGGRPLSMQQSSWPAAHAKYSDRRRTSCPLESDTQQRLGIENPVANTCKISINTGQQERASRTSDGARVVVGNSSSSSDDQRCPRKQNRLRKSLSRPPQSRKGRTARRCPRRPVSSSSSSSSLSSCPPAPPARRTRARSGVAPINCTGMRTASTRRQHIAGPQPACSGRGCPSKSGGKHVHSHPCKHHRRVAHPSVRYSDSCGRTANMCDGPRHVHGANSLKRSCVAHGPPRQILCNAMPPLRSRTCFQLPACSADRCPADASPVGVSTLSVDKTMFPRRSMEHARCHPRAVAPTGSLYSHHPPFPACRQGRSAPTHYGDSVVRSHSSCHISGAGQMTRTGRPTCSRSAHAHRYPGAAYVRDHSCCQPLGCRDTGRHPPGSYRRFPSAPPFTSHSPPLYLPQRLSQPPRRCPCR